jgi:DNA invertase Pin-like site-specific DNA recombinase
MRQREVCTKHANEHGYKVLKIIEDVISGADYNRPGIWRLRRLVQAGVVDEILVEGRDRWTRGAVGFRILENWLNDKGISVEVCDPDEIEFRARLDRLLREEV